MKQWEDIEFSVDDDPDGSYGEPNRITNSPWWTEVSMKEMVGFLPSTNFDELLKLDGWHPRSPSSDLEGRYYFIALGPCKLRLQRPDGNIGPPIECEEGDLIWTEYPVQRWNGLPMCQMPDRLSADTRRNEILALRALHAVSRACRRDA